MNLQDNVKALPISDAGLVDLLKFDPLQAAEDMCDGVSYQESEAVKLLGVGLAMKHASVKAEVLKIRDDTTLSNELDNYQRIIMDIGFELAAEFPFVAQSYGKEPPRDERYFVYAHREYGIILTFDTFCSTSVNGGHFYYCWKPNKEVKHHSVTESGGLRSESTPVSWKGGIPEDAYWDGDHDSREAIRFKITQLAANGTFLKSWPTPSQGRKKSGFYLMSYVDWKLAMAVSRDGREPRHYDKYQDRVFQRRYEALPDWVKEIIGPMNLETA